MKNKTQKKRFTGYIGNIGTSSSTAGKMDENEVAISGIMHGVKYNLKIKK